jgi:ABC-type uncharacterized transport system involved in gliding motility auxiliary subunit
MFGGRSARYGTLASASILIVVALIAGINYIAARQNKRWDLTSSKQYTLSEQTQKVLRSLQKPVNVKVFEKENEFDRFRGRLAEYEYVTDKLKTEYIDPDKKPAMAKQYQIQSYGTVVFEYDTRLERVTSDSEQELTNALIKAVEGKQKKVYFAQGHGEKDTASAERDGYNAIAGALPSQNFGIDKLVLAQNTAVPDDASVVVFAGPKVDLLQPEVDALRAYLKKGGKLLFLLDPPQTAEAPPLTNVLALLKEWGIDVGTDVVVDVSGMGQLIGTDATVPLAASYPSHPIVQNFGLLTAYPLSRSIAPVSGGSNGKFAQTFIETSPRSWAEKDIKGLLTTGKVAMDEASGDKKGPISIGTAVSAAADEAPKPEGDAAAKSDAPKPESRIVAIGDSDFGANNFLGVQGNRDIFFNTLNWLAQQENLIAIAPKNQEDRRLTLTATQQQNLFYLSVLLIPGMILAAGVYSWWQRR